MRITQGLKQQRLPTAQPLPTSKYLSATSLIKTHNYTEISDNQSRDRSQNDDKSRDRSTTMRRNDQ